MQNDCEDMVENMGFRATEVGSSDEEEMDPEDRKKRAQKLTEALAVLAIRPPQFHSLSNSGRLEPLRKLLEKSMKERVDTYPERQKILKLIKAEEEDSDEDAPRIHRQITKGKEGYTPYINEEADLPTIHEAYQFLVKTYIENVLIRKQRKSSVMKKSRAVNAFIKSPQHGPKNDKNGVDNEDKKKEKKKKKKTKKDELDEENQKLLSQIEDMVGGLGIDDPLQGGSSVSRSRRGSRVPIPEGLGIDGSGAPGNRSRRGSFAPGMDLGIDESGSSRSRRGSRIAPGLADGLGPEEEGGKNGRSSSRRNSRRIGDGGDPEEEILRISKLARRNSRRIKDGMGLSIDEGGVRSRRGSVLAGGSDMLGEENKPGLGDLSHQLSLGGQLSRNAKRKSQRKKKKSKDKDLDD